MPARLSKYEAALELTMSPELLDWFTRNAPKTEDQTKLPFTLDVHGVASFDRQDLKRWDRYLRDPWPSEQRDVPRGIEREIILESRCLCAICGEAHYSEVAHIEDWASSRCHHPHNVINLCPNCHTRFDRGQIAKDVVKQKKREILDRKCQDWRLAHATHKDLDRLQTAGRVTLRTVFETQFANAVIERPFITVEIGYGSPGLVTDEQLNLAARSLGQALSDTYPTASGLYYGEINRNTDIRPSGVMVPIETAPVQVLADTSDCARLVREFTDTQARVRNCISLVDWPQAAVGLDDIARIVAQMQTLCSPTHEAARAFEQHLREIVCQEGGGLDEGLYQAFVVAARSALSLT